MEFNLDLGSFRDTTNWISGTIGECKFEAKHFDVGSCYGINDGRVSKLWVRKGDTTIISYDRGGDIEPSTENDKLVLEELIKNLENLPKRFEV